MIFAARLTGEEDSLSEKGQKKKLTSKNSSFMVTSEGGTPL